MATFRNQSWLVRVSLLAVSAGLVTSGVISTPMASAAESAALSSMEKRAFDNINTQRAEKGCAALVVDPNLQQAAHDYAVEMVRTGNFSHTSATGQSPTDRAKAAGYKGGVGENIAMGFRDDPNGVVNNGTYGWMNSAGHRANILNCNYTRTGMGYDSGNIDPAYADGSWVQVFG
ncbi:CAP domain-containing protein [Streptomyces sp. NPDC050704]|uniref:CAP domain-containing protein n=1 Tax=Streptomyces sp. NPDC050704 TaxID=3157219 RepID=UPI00342BA562